MIKVLILGGGFGGVRAALDLNKKLGRSKRVEVTLIDKNNYQTFHPNLYEIASLVGVYHQHPFHTKIRKIGCVPFDDIFNGTEVKLVQAEVKEINITQNKVITNGDLIFDYDFLIIALGSVVSTFGIAGVGEYAFKFKDIDDALMIIDKIHDLYSKAQEEGHQFPIKIVIGGAGFTGIEVAAELSRCVRHVIDGLALSTDQTVCSKITLVETAKEILPSVSNKERKVIRQRLEKLGIEILENVRIKEVESNQVVLENGNALEADMIIWSAGTAVPEIIKSNNELTLDERGRILVDDFMKMKNSENVFAIGDNTIFVDSKNNKPVPQMAFVAIEQGRIAAENICRFIRDRSKIKKYKPFYDVWVAPVGGKYAIAHLWGVNLVGFWGYLVRQAIDFRYFTTILPLTKAIKLFAKDMAIFVKND